ncbi:MAG: cysteine--tRNA ligase [Candidatus Aminicenantes bacterium]|nr:cysteine--tRNA ligase [Candidatus Aminicenantes bacterium]
MLKLFNTLSGKIESFQSLEKGHVKLYTCGPTVYDYAHIGNYRAYMFEDLLKRLLLFLGFKVTHAMNITDVDDKTIIGAQAEGVTIQEYTKKYIDSFYTDLETLNILKADYYPRATDHIPEMVKLIQRLLDKGIAYRKNGSIYFSIEKFPNYGRLSKIELSELRPGERVDSDEYEKESVHDFVLWKEKKAGEPFWETDLGDGRPGWHIECSAMSSKYLGETFDIHCGGVDNIFPHHENEIAQSEAASGHSFVNFWIHCHHLIVDGEKMSKSKNNQFTLKDLKNKGIDPMGLRLLLLSTHYRKMLNFTFDACWQAQSSVQRIKDFLFELKHRPFKEGESIEVGKNIATMMNKFTSGLCDDLNISIALTVFFEMIKRFNVMMTKDEIYSKDPEKIISAVNKINSVLGILKEECEDDLSPEILEKIESRQQARKEKNFSLSDQIRDELSALGIILEDTKDGTVRWKKK